MPSSREYLDYVLEQLSGLEEITFRPMMGEYLLYYRGKLMGGVYDNRLLVKPAAAARALMPAAPEEIPYEGAKPMLLVEDMENPVLLSALFSALYQDIPAPRKKQKQGGSSNGKQQTP